MEIKRVINANEEELNLLISAGTMLGEIKKQKEAGAFDLIDDKTRELLMALNEVITILLQ